MTPSAKQIAREFKGGKGIKGKSIPELAYKYDACDEKLIEAANRKYVMSNGRVK